MLISQFDKFVNRSTQEILGSEIERENLEPMLSTDIVRSGGNVTGVKGENEIYYRTGNVNLTSADIGALDENNVYNGLDQTNPGYALDARQGKALDEAIDDKLDKDNVYNGLDQTNPGYALDARQGNALDEAINDKLDKANVYNGLDKTEAGYALDARQGKALDDKISTVNTGIISIDSRIQSGTIDHVNLRKVGNIVYASARVYNFSTSSTGTFFNIPSEFRPYNDTYVTGYMLIDGNMMAPVLVEISASTGNINFHYSDTHTTTQVAFAGCWSIL